MRPTDLSLGKRLFLFLQSSGVLFQASSVSDCANFVKEKISFPKGGRKENRIVALLYISCRNGHTVSAVETLEKFARALDVPLYQLFYDGEKPPQIPNLLKTKTPDDVAWGSSGRQAIYLYKLYKLRNCLSKVGDGDRQLLLSLVQKMATGRKRPPQTSRA
jgi:hypothetical protein